MTAAVRVAILSDVHADVRALEDALAVIDRLGADRIFCAGDLVDYGAHPDDTLALLRDRKIPCIRGNHDRWAAGSRLVRTGWDPARDSMEYLRTLPTRIDETIEGVRVAIRHGTPSSDMRGVWPIRTTREELAAHLQDTASDILVVGHTHLPFRLDVSGSGSIVNPGALLREPTGRVAKKPILFDAEARRFVTGPGPGGGTFGILELPSRRFTVHRASDGSTVRPIELAY